MLVLPEHFAQAFALSGLPALLLQFSEYLRIDRPFHWTANPRLAIRQVDDAHLVVSIMTVAYRAALDPVGGN